MIEEKASEKTNTNKELPLTQGKMMQALDWAYEKTMTGLPGQGDINTLVEDYLSKSNYNCEVAIAKLIKSQKTKASTSGFVTGFGGVITMPITIPANVASVLLIQMRMIAAIATMRGYDLKSDQVKTFVYATLAGTSVADIVKKTGITIGNKTLSSTVNKISGKTLTKINQAVGYRLITKSGTKGTINLWKAIPIAGALVGGSFDFFTTSVVANRAKKTFAKNGINVGEGIIIDKSDC